MERVFTRSQNFDYSFMEQHLIISTGQKDDFESDFFFCISILAIIIASRGLLGLSSFSAEQRTKDMVVRKVNGASVITIIRLLFMEINRLFIIATILAWPIGHGIAMSIGLRNLRTGLSLAPMNSS